MPNPSRRDLLRGAAAAAALAACRRSPQVQVPRILVPRGVQAGDVDGDTAVVWAQSDRPARMRVEWDTTARFANPRRVEGPAVDAVGDLAGTVALAGLPAGQTIVYRVVFEDGRDRSAPAVGRFVTPPPAGTTWRFA